MRTLYADIIVDISHEKLDRTFQYRVPESLRGRLEPGACVMIPFGNGNRLIKGYVVALGETCQFAPEKIKDIAGMPEKETGVEDKMIALAAWIRRNYGCTMIQALKPVLPVKKKEKIRQKRTVHLLLDEEAGKRQLDIYLHKNQKARARLLAGLLDQPVQEYELLTKKLNVTGTVIRTLEEQKILTVEYEDMLRNPVDYQKKTGKQIVYTEEQERAIRTFVQDYQAGKRKTYLLYGITGSGKTEVYMEMIQAVLQENKQVIMLIPEIALTYQTVVRFQKRFGDRVTVLNSRMSEGEKYDQYERAKQGEVDIVVGPRSALFIPFSNLGLILIDEEHEMSYKSEKPPKYHARDVAIERARQSGASVVLGSATPSVESYENWRVYTSYVTAPSKPSQYAKGLCGGFKERIRRRKPLNFQPCAAGENRGTVKTRGADHTIFKPAWICRLCFL